MRKTKHMKDDPEFIRMRTAVIKEYDSPSWRFRVSKMKESQIIAIYFSIQKRKYAKVKQEKEFHQVTLFDLYPEEMMIYG